MTDSPKTANLAQIDLLAVVGSLVLNFGILESSLIYTVRWLEGREPPREGPGRRTGLVDVDREGADARSLVGRCAGRGRDLGAAQHHVAVGGPQLPGAWPHGHQSCPLVGRRAGLPERQRGAHLGQTDELRAFEPRVYAVTKDLETTMPSPYRRVRYGDGPFIVGA